MTSASLRLRLTLIILIPLLAIAGAVSAWQVNDARDKAGEIFDRSLLSAALAISADIARTSGDALSIEARDRLRDTSGGQVFYHVYAPDGVFVTGYATPPVPIDRGALPSEGSEFYTAQYYGRDVRVLRLRDNATIGGISGLFTYTVWQDVDLREAFVQDLSKRSFFIMAILIGSVACVVWFGVRLGLRPLLDLEDAISARSSGDLRPIQRAVPQETQGLVERLNSLFRQVDATMTAQKEFISNAAHQLRNPLAGVLAMAEAVASAPTPEATRSRARELVASAQRTSDLANKLLTLERMQADPEHMADTAVDLNKLISEVSEAHARRIADAGVALDTPEDKAPVMVSGDAIMLREALTNLVDNAQRHGGDQLQRITLSAKRMDHEVVLTVADDGQGVTETDVPVVLSRFGQVGPGDGSGLGLSIAQAVAERHGGRIALNTDPPGLGVSLILPAS
ncbi:MAG: sensor histidine kinase [Dinoroseobacter sp.]|nr:sensor histidine kinase [Dinoroseobacter sp.]